MFQRIVPLLLTAALTSSLACDGGDEQPTQPDEPSPQVTTVEVTPSSVELKALGATQDFDATARDQNGNRMSGVSFSWSVSPNSVASVDSEGTVTAEAEGDATVEARASGVSGSANLTVDQEVAAVQVSPDSVLVNGVGDTAIFSAEPVDANGRRVSDEPVNWSSTRESVATVDSVGRAEAEGSGIAQIVAQAGGATDSAFFGVPGPPTANISSPEDETAFEEGTSVTLEGSGSDPVEGDLQGQSLEWISDKSGQLGTGQSLTVSNLSTTSHTITLRVTDGDNNTASDSAEVLIESPGFDIRLRFLDTFSEAERSTIRRALEPWTDAITSDLRPVFVSDSRPVVPGEDPVEDCGLEEEGIDDLLLVIQLSDIDGRGGALAAAGPCIARTDSDGNFTTSASGTIEIDQADRDNPDFEETVTHEVGHALGFGVEQLDSWGSSATALNTFNPSFRGENAVEAFDNLTGREAYINNGVPLANTGGAGTAGGHWRESNFGIELMTGTANGGIDEPLSRVSIASLADIGYSVDMSAADPFNLPMPQRAIWLANGDATISAPESADENFGSPSGSTGSTLDSVLVTGANNGQLWSNDPEDEVFAAFVRFDVPTSLPGGGPVTVEESRIHLRVTGRSTETPNHDVLLVAVTEDWSENSITWNTQPATLDRAALVFDYQFCNTCLLTNAPFTGLTVDWLNGDLANHGLLIWAPDARSDRTFSVGYWARHTSSPFLRPWIEIDARTGTGSVRADEVRTQEKIPRGNDIREGYLYGVNPAGETVRVVRIGADSTEVHREPPMSVDTVGSSACCRD